MSVSKWKWTPDCDKGICVGDCDQCDRSEPVFGKWILCSERLPKLSFSYDTEDGYDCYESELVLVTTDYDCVHIAYLSSVVVTDKKRYEEICGGEPCGPEWFSRDQYENDVIPVIAWMPLPEPYGGES